MPGLADRPALAPKDMRMGIASGFEFHHEVENNTEWTALMM